MLNKSVGANHNSIQRIADHGKVLTTDLGDYKSLAFPIKEREPERNLQRLDLLTHGRLCDGQLFSCTSEAFAPRRSLERLESIQWWQAAAHRTFS